MLSTSITENVIVAEGTEVLNISKHGFWLMIHGREYYLPFEDFPWFRNATIGEILLSSYPSPITSTGQRWMSTYISTRYNIRNAIP